MEDEPDRSNPNPTTTTTTTVHPEHAAMLHRLSHRTTTSATATATSTSNPTQSFLSLFSQQKLSIESSLSTAAEKSHLAPISAAIENLEKAVADSSYFLPLYELRTCLQTTSTLKETLDSISSQVAPKKPFKFRNKSKPETGVPESPASSFFTPESPEVLSKDLNNGETPIPELTKSSFSIPESPGFRNRENEVLSKELENGEFVISDLDSCEVRLKGCFRALFVHKLRNCRIYSGPVLGSVLIEEVEDCVFVLASHQIRIHNAKRGDFYLRVRSRPIVEDCGDMRFAPYCLGYEGIERDLREVKLDEENGNWGNVDDFKWLKGFQSPNWSVLPERERIGKVIIS